MSAALLSAVEQLRMLREREISAVELAEEYIRRIERLNPLLNAFVDFDAERVREQARQAAHGSLAGLPLTIKSSIEVQGQHCEIGSVLRRGVMAAGDAEVVRRLRCEGAVFLGTTNCPEFLMAYETDNLLHGRTNNPWDVTRTAGGSSGGESAAIAAGLSAGGFGSDSGGSVREPAHFTGICSLKPTAGRVSAQGHQPPCVGPFASLGAVGPMARTVDDVELLFQTVCGGDGIGAPGTYRSVDLEDARRVTIGWIEEDGLVPVTVETREAVRSAAELLGRSGFKVEQIGNGPLLDMLEEARRLWYVFFVQCGAMFYESTIAGRRDELSPIFAEFLRIAEAEKPLTADSLLQAWANADVLRLRVLAEMKRYPVLLTPVCSVPAFRHGERAWTIGASTVGYLDAMRYTQWFNLLASPAAVVPVGRSPEGLPIGVQVAGRPYADELVLRVARVLDAEFGYAAPPIR
jgi:amidase